MLRICLGLKSVSVVSGLTGNLMHFKFTPNFKGLFSRIGRDFDVFELFMNRNDTLLKLLWKLVFI
jgi:hypothetical protein